MSWNNDGISIWGFLFGVGVASVCAYNSGRKDTIQEVQEYRRDREIENLKREISELKRLKEIT